MASGVAGAASASGVEDAASASGVEDAASASGVAGAEPDMVWQEEQRDFKKQCAARPRRTQAEHAAKRNNTQS